MFMTSRPAHRMLWLVLLPGIAWMEPLAGAQAVQHADDWGEVVEGLQLRLVVADGPRLATTAADWPPLQLQLRNQGPVPVTYIDDALFNPEIEIDGVWYSYTRTSNAAFWSPVEIPPGGKSDPVEFRVPQVWLGTQQTPARALELTPGKHWIRVRVNSGARYDGLTARSRPPPVLTSKLVRVVTSNLASFEVPGDTDTKGIR